MNTQEIINKINSASNNVEFENACNLIEDQKLRNKALDVVWYSMTLDQDKKLAIDLLSN